MYRIRVVVGRAEMVRSALLGAVAKRRRTPKPSHVRAGVARSAMSLLRAVGRSLRPLAEPHGGILRRGLAGALS